MYHLTVVALDQACADMANQAPIIPDSTLDHQPHHTHDHFINNHPETDWRSCLEHAEKLGLGTRDYEMIKV